jgi:predicted nucleic acid-binding protein
MRIYLDACSLQRPLDDRTQPRINIEAEAVLTVLRLVESGELELLSSEALEFEINRIPHQHRKGWATEMLKLANHIIELNDEIETQADNFVQAGIQPMDALHLASASWMKADYFCTCDDRLLKSSRNLKGLTTGVVSPLQLVAEVAP